MMRNTDGGRIITALKRAFNWALKMGLVERNPIAAMKKPAAKKRDKVISPSEYTRLLENVPDQQFKDLLVVSYETGCRPQEVKTLEARHVDFANKRWVLPTLESKGKRKPRVVYATASVLAILDRLTKQYPEGKLFRNRRGSPWSASAVKCRFVRLEKKLGVRYCQYAFRHSFAHRKGLVVTVCRIELSSSRSAGRWRPKRN